jgi:hypothetical protein
MKEWLSVGNSIIYKHIYIYYTNQKKKKKKEERNKENQYIRDKHILKGRYVSLSKENVI